MPGPAIQPLTNKSLANSHSPVLRNTKVHNIITDMLSSMPLPTSEPTSDIEVQELSLSYLGGDRDLPVLESLTFRAERGEFLGIVGPSGCGKTTLLRVLADLLSEDEKVGVKGKVRVMGASPKLARTHRQFGFLFQTPTLLPWRNVLENVLISEDLIHHRKESAIRNAKSLLDAFELSDFSRSPVWHLSGGMQQRVALARAFFMKPRILFLDEPFTGLDDLSRITLIDHLQQAAASLRATTIFVSHNIGDVVAVCDRVLVMSPRPARIAGSVPIDLARPRNSTARYSEAYITARARIDSLMREL